MEGSKLNIRLAVMVALALVLLTASAGQLFAMQNAPPSGPDTTASRERTVIEYQTIPAARGGLYDRYGRPLVTNRPGLRLTLDETRLRRAEDPAGEILKLIAAAEADGVVIRDLLPVTAPPYEFNLTAEDDLRAVYLEEFLARKKYEPMDADALIARLREDYGIAPETPAVQARKAAGVFYELELRHLFTRVEPYRYIAPYVFAQDVSMELVSVVLEQGIAGCVPEPFTSRVYETEYAAHILGRTGPIPAGELEYYTQLGYRRDDIVGLDGAENAFESWLRGTPGRKAVEQTESGRVRDVFYSTEPEPGRNVYLTIDIRFQQRVEEILEAGILYMQEHNGELMGQEAEAGAIAVVDVRSGEVLAMANYPTYSLSSFLSDYVSLRDDPLRPMINRSVAGLYSPGSVFKMVTAAAALETGRITAGTRIYDDRQFTRYPDFQPRCLIYPGSHGSINVCDALKVSCNYFFYEIGYTMGIRPIREWAERFGLGQSTGIELGGERTGYIASPETAAALGLTWQQGLTLVASIGQSDNLFTPLQMANYTAAIANGGTVNRVHLMREAKSYDFTQTHAVESGGVLRETGASAATIDALRRGMLSVSMERGGSAYQEFGDYPVQVAAKTGSVETGIDRPINGVFVAYAPYGDPEIAVCVVIEKGGAGFRAAPFARKVFDAWYELKDERETAAGENLLQK
ncbi:MAG: penicillin-binding transpeptidase domain-containing protein [Oscillospiraceae bacterium]|nr:penicillin-binding transpeptidase domain-containing protein [Oscillospiraceae bacterium]